MQVIIKIVFQFQNQNQSLYIDLGMATTGQSQYTPEVHCDLGPQCKLPVSLPVETHKQSVYISGYPN